MIDENDDGSAAVAAGVPERKGPATYATVERILLSVEDLRGRGYAVDLHADGKGVRIVAALEAPERRGTPCLVGEGRTEDDALRVLTDAYNARNGYGRDA